MPLIAIRSVARARSFRFVDALSRFTAGDIMQESQRMNVKKLQRKVVSPASRRANRVPRKCYKLVTA